MRIMKRALNRILKGQRGFTLVEMVVVVAIMGVMAAVAVPVVTNNLSKSKERAYAQDIAMIQTAVDSYYTAADNPRHLGLRQYPINAANDTGDNKDWDAANSADIAATPRNPALGTQGGEPYWTDDANGLREADEEKLFGEAVALGNNGDGGWYPSRIDLKGTEYAVDSRGYFIDFATLVANGLLKSPPESASSDNGGVAEGSGGSYSWYVDSNGSVNSILAVFPYNGLNFDGTAIDGASDLRGFQEGVYP